MNDVFNDDWIGKLKVGDKVVVAAGGWDRSQDICKVDRITKAQIFVNWRSNNPTAFWKKNGYIVGSDVWHYSYLVELTPELKSKITEVNKRSKATSLCRNADISKLPMETVEKIIELLEVKDGKS
jgi:hypothetical protein